MVAELSESEKEQLAREVAANKAVGCASVYNEDRRRDFLSGWDAAVEHLHQREQESSS